VAARSRRDKSAPLVRPRAVMTQSQKELLALRGKIVIEYDWEQEDILELKAAEEREWCRDSEKPS